MNLNEILLSITALIGLLFAVPALAADLDGDGVVDSPSGGASPEGGSPEGGSP